MRGIKGVGVSLWVCARGVCVPGSPGPAPQDVSPQACTLLLMVLFIYDIFFVFITPFLTKVGAPDPCPAPLTLSEPHAPRPHSDVALLC